jgi:hypothetical protein
MNLLDSSLIFSIIGALGNGATALALFFIWKQSRLAEQQAHMTREELEVTLPRPWVGTTNISYTPDTKEMQIFFKNFGQIPAKVMRLIAKDSDLYPSRKDIADGYERSTEITLFPEQPEKSYNVPATGKALPFVGFILEYEYSSKKKKGIYGVIYEYFPNSNRFATKDEWFE